MATQITQTTNSEGSTVLRVEGDMLLDDAILLERLVQGGDHGVSGSILIDLADLDFIDSDAASVLKRLRDEHGVQIEGIEIFLQSAINSVER